MGTIGEKMKIKEKLKQFGILVIRLIWPGRPAKGTQRIGLFILGVGLLFGVSQAGTIQKLVSASLRDEATTTGSVQTNIAKTDIRMSKDQGTDVPAAQTKAGKIEAPNIVDLINDSEVIFRGAVKKVSDGIENGVPYTEVTIQVAEQIRGDVGKEYTFRQFGLIRPRKMDNGRTNLMVTPEGWAKYKQDEDVVLFLHKKAAITGLRTTAGLGQGKLNVKGGNVESELGNIGLFESVSADQSLLNDRDQRLLATRKGAVNSESFMSFVRRAVSGNWVSGGKLRHADNK